MTTLLETALDLGQFVGGTLFNGLTLSSSGPIMIDEFFKRHFSNTNTKLEKRFPQERRRFLELAFMGYAILFSLYSSYRKERDENVAAKATISDLKSRLSAVPKPSPQSTTVLASPVARTVVKSEPLPQFVTFVSLNGSFDAGSNLEQVNIVLKNGGIETVKARISNLYIFLKNQKCRAENSAQFLILQESQANSSVKVIGECPVPPTPGFSTPATARFTVTYDTVPPRGKRGATFTLSGFANSDSLRVLSAGKIEGQITF